MNIVILTTRVAGTDGVTLEATHWKNIIERMGHKVTLVAGELDQPGILLPELHFQHPEVVVIHDKVIFGKGKYEQIESDIFEIAGKIEGKLREVFNNGKYVDLLIVPNAFSIPMHFPLAVALARTIEDLGIPTLARHHDFWWERERFLNSSMFGFFKKWFPPLIPQVKHTVVNTIAQKEFKKRTGIKADIFWDTFDFNSGLNELDSYSKHWRDDFGIEKDDLVFLQPTRIVPRKRIELSIDLIRRLNHPKAVLVLAGYAGDEGKQYEVDLKRHAMRAKIRFLSIGDYINSKRKLLATASGKLERHRVYTLWDSFVNSDFVTYPTQVEGFGNQFVETMYFKKPIIITPYPVFRSDIEPLGFEIILMTHKVTQKAVRTVRELIENPDKKKKMVEGNFKLGKKHYSYETTGKKLKKVFKEMKIKGA